MIPYILIQMQKCVQSLKIYSRQPKIHQLRQFKWISIKSFLDCGVYGIAVATSLAFGIDPTDVALKQDVMRS